MEKYSRGSSCVTTSMSKYEIGPHGIFPVCLLHQMICLGAKVEQYDHLIITTPQREKKKKSLGTNTFFLEEMPKKRLMDQGSATALCLNKQAKTFIGYRGPQFLYYPSRSYNPEKKGKEASFPELPSIFTYVRHVKGRPLFYNSVEAAS